MTDVEILADFFMVDHVAQRLGWMFCPELCAEAVRELQALAAEPDTHPDLVMQVIHKLQIAIGPTNLAAVVTHPLWDDWCPQPAGVDNSDRNNDHGVVVWVGKQGYVKLAEADVGADGKVELNVHSVRT
jgi:hypothetical protein